MTGPDTAAQPDPPPSDAGQRIKRRQHLEHHLRASPTDLEAFLELARIYRVDDRPIEARRVLEQARDIFPDDQRVTWELEEAILARSLQQLREVRDLAERLHTPEADHELSRARGDWARRRIDVCRARLSRDPDRMQLRIALGEALLDADDYRTALSEVAPALESDEFSCQAHLLRGRCFLALGDDASALPALRAAALRRGVIPPPKTKLAALRLLCDVAERLGLTLTLERYRQHLDQAERSVTTPTP